MNIRLTWIPFWALFTREIRRFMKVLFQTLATPVINTTLYLLIFGVSIGKQIDSIGDFSYIAFLIPGLAMMATLRNTLDNAVGSIVVSKFCGELEDLRMAPLSPTQIAWAHGLGSLVRGLMVGYVTLAIGLIFYYFVEGETLHIAHPALLLLLQAAGGLAFAHLGMTIALFSHSFDQVNAINTFLLLPLIYLGGVFFSLDHLHPFWQTLSQLNPLLYLVNGVRYAVLGVSDVPIATSLAVMAATVVIFYCMGIWGLKKGAYGRW